MTNTSGCPGTERSRSTTTRPARSRSTPSVAVTGRCRDACGPQHGPCIEAFGAQCHPAGIDTGDPRVLANLDAQPQQRSSRGVAQLRREGWKNGRPRLDEHDARRVRVDVAELLARLAGDLGKRSGKLDARRAAADEHERQQPLLPRRVGFALRALERDENAAPDVERILERLQAGRVRSPLVVAEIRVARSGGHDQDSRTR